MAKSVRQKEINFLTVLSGRSARKKLKPRSFIMPGVLVLLVLAGVGVFALMHAATLQVYGESDAARAYLDSPETTRLLADAKSVETEAANVLAGELVVSQPMQNLATYPDLTSAQYRQIREYAGINVELLAMGYDRSTGILSFAATSEHVYALPTFIAQLRASGIFNDVSYLGYASNVSPTLLSTSTNRTDTSSTGTASSSTSVEVQAPLYSFNVECSVKVPDPTASTGEER